MRNWIADFANDITNNGRFESRKQKDGTEFVLVDSWHDIRRFNDFLKANNYETETELREEDSDDWLDEILSENDGLYGFSDEWFFCDGCGEAERFDEPHWETVYERYCADCVKEMAEDYIKDCLLVNWELGIPCQMHGNAILPKETLTEYGFKPIKTDLEVGFYGTNDDPTEILSELINANQDNDYICHITSNNPFATYYEIWEREN